MVKEVILRRTRYEELLEQLDILKTVKRKEIAERIKIARDFGDLSENSEYDEAKNDQAFLEGEIMKLEEMLKNAVVIADEEEEGPAVVSLGSKVTVYDKEFDEEVVYQVVGATESNMKEMKISTDSPLGSALINKKVGDVVEVKAPDSTLSFVIRKIER